MKLVLVFAAACAFAQSPIETPVVGYMRDAGGNSRAVLGVAGNFVLGPRVAEAPEYQPRSRRRTENDIPPGATTALLLDDGVLYATPERLTLRHDDASEVHFPVTGVKALRRMSAEYVQVSADRELALRVEAGREAIYVLPRVESSESVPQRRAPSGDEDAPRRTRTR